MKATSQNRYGDNIIFEKLDNKTIKMSGYKPEWVRCGYPNVYDDAYAAYCKDIEEPMSLEQFKDKIHNSKFELLKKYQSLVYSDTSTYNMVDPSGGPYVAVGGNLKYYFEAKKDMIIESIDVKSDYALLGLESNN
jgi:hypothetical protein